MARGQPGTQQVFRRKRGRRGQVLELDDADRAVCNGGDGTTEGMTLTDVRHIGQCWVAVKYVHAAENARADRTRQ